MTIPIERSGAIKNVRHFLKILTDPKETPKVPKEIRRMAARLLKHYPSEFYMEQTRKLAPDVWGENKDD